MFRKNVENNIFPSKFSKDFNSNINSSTSKGLLSVPEQRAWSECLVVDSIEDCGVECKRGSNSMTKDGCGLCVTADVKKPSYL